MRLFRLHRQKLSVSILVLLLAVSAAAQQRLIVIGGGTRPPEAMKKFIEWSGGAKAHILVITWASGDQSGSFKALKDSLAGFETEAIESSPASPIDPEKRTSMLAKLGRATGIFFTGGDQNRIMEVLKDKELLKIFRDKYAAGMPFAGTSAGAAVMSDPMMTGDADLKILDGSKVGVRTGLGLVPNVMFDQHFLVRQRHNRLFGFIMQNPGFLGIGIDEDNAVLITDDRKLQVVGTTYVMFVDAKDKKGSFVVTFLKPGEWFDLKKRKRMSAPRN